MLGSGEGAKYVAWTLAEQGKLHWKETPELQEALARRADALRTKVRRKLREGRESRVKLLLINLHYENARAFTCDRLQKNCRNTFDFRLNGVAAG